MILITGGLGHIGSATVQALLDIGEECVLIQRRSPEIPAGRFSRPVTAVQGDVKDLEALRAIGRDHAITGIVHMAGSMPWPPNPDEAPVEAAREALGGLFNIIQVASEWGVKRVSLASTIGVYAGLSNTGALSEDLPVPLTAPHVIPTFKKISELLGHHLAGATGLEIIHLRISGAWGPLGHLPNFAFPAPQFVHAAATGTPVDLSGVAGRLKADDGLDLCYVYDLGRATALLQTADALTYATYNVASGRIDHQRRGDRRDQIGRARLRTRARARFHRAGGLPRHHPIARRHRLPAGMGPRALGRRLHRVLPCRQHAIEPASARAGLQLVPQTRSINSRTASGTCSAVQRPVRLLRCTGFSKSVDLASLAPVASAVVVAAVGSGSRRPLQGAICRSRPSCSAVSRRRPARSAEADDHATATPAARSVIRRAWCR